MILKSSITRRYLWCRSLHLGQKVSDTDWMLNNSGLQGCLCDSRKMIKIARFFLDSRSHGKMCFCYNLPESTVCFYWKDTCWLAWYPESTANRWRWFRALCTCNHWILDNNLEPFVVEGQVQRMDQSSQSKSVIWQRYSFEIAVSVNMLGWMLQIRNWFLSGWKFLVLFISLLWTLTCTYLQKTRCESKFYHF